jgi:hypothetical protein
MNEIAFFKAFKVRGGVIYYLGGHRETAQLGAYNHVKSEIGRKKPWK